MLNKIIETSKYITNNSKYVKINESKVDEFASEMKDIKLSHWLSSSPCGLLDLPVETIINFLLINDTLDFSFWGNPKWTIETVDGEKDGSIALLYALLEYVKTHGTTDFSNVSEGEFAKILKGNVEIPLFKERYNIIKNISQTVNSEMNGNFYEYIKNINSDTELFELLINKFPSLKDERTYNGQTIYFYKLAQLLTSDILHIRALKENIDADYSHLVGCSDYKIPQVMRGLGLLEYNSELSELVDNKKELPENSIYEVEIRANMITVIDMIKEKLEGKVCAIDINDYIWCQSKNKKFNFKPYHLTRTTGY